MPCIFVPISQSSSSLDSFAFEGICFLCFKRKFDSYFLVLRLVLGCKIENRYVYSSVSLVSRLSLISVWYWYIDFGENEIPGQH